jgi:UDP-N-acetylmuramoyl-tripeptide--D-alanyl-D-alanine ligase
MDYLLSIVHPDIAVITTIGLSHYEFFHDAAAIEEEKGKLAKAVSGNDVLIVNADNEVALRQSNKAQGKVLTYSIRNQADIMIADIKESLEGKYNTTFSVVTPHKQFDGQVNAIGSVHLSALAAAISVAEVLNIDTDSIKKGLIQYKPTPGRLNIISGIKHTTIIDDSYNASPASMAEALALLARLPASSKMAVLGDMLELGAQSDPAHERAGKTVAELSPDYLITIGASGKIIAEAARQNGMNSEKIISFDTSDEARKTVQDLLQPESLVLIKGSQGKRMEKITAEIMAEPMRAHELLCRQHGKWLES